MAGAVDLELNGVPVRTATPLPVSIASGTAVTQDVNAKTWGGATLAAGVGALAAQTYASVRGLTDSVIRADDGSTYSVPSLYQPASAAGKGLGVMDVRKVGYPSSVAGRAFVAISQSQATFTGQTAFAATTPTILFRNNAGTKQIILRRLVLSQTGTVAGGPISVIIAVDSADRFSSGGTALGLKNVNKISGAAAAITSVLVNPTATAAGGGTDYIYHRVYAQTVTAIGNQIVIDCEDEVQIGTTGAILVYAFAASTGPTFAIEPRWEEV